ncbi:hypothetical protein OJAV_G00145220 [Oryzias javanicus]|uniref:Uncharacterized protein n=1 Tax=Oryzias javanicus TaxID=123683 RepID=A0A437CNH1_ORYJA|nr:hypothetical protein OJAV_G00145220 [Oryzias javanicus]
MDAAEDSDDGPICVPALISPPRSAGEDVDLSPPDIGMASLDFDPMSFQCSGPDGSFAFPTNDSPAAEGPSSKRSPGSSNLLSAPPLSSLAADRGRSEGEKTESRRLTSSFSYTEKPTQAVSPIKCSKAPSLMSFPLSEPPSSETPDRGPAEPLSAPPPALKDPPPVAGSLPLRGAEPSLSEAFQVELQAKLAAFEPADGRNEDGPPPPATSRQEQRGVPPPDSVSSDPPSCSLSPVAPPLLKNPALMLAFTESTQLVCSQPQPRPSEAPPPASLPQPQKDPAPPPVSAVAPASFHPPTPSLPVKPEKPSRPAAEPQRQPDADSTSSNAPALSTSASLTSPAKTVPNQRTIQGPDLEATPISTVLAPPIPEVRPEGPAPLQTLPKLPDPLLRKPKSLLCHCLSSSSTAKLTSSPPH